MVGIQQKRGRRVLEQACVVVPATLQPRKPRQNIRAFPGQQPSGLLAAVVGASQVASQAMVDGDQSHTRPQGVQQRFQRDVFLLHGRGSIPYIYHRSG